VKPSEVIAGTKVKITGLRVFRDYEIGYITKSGFFEDETKKRLLAEVRMDSGAYRGRSFSISLSNLEVLEPVEDRV
jgi:hypothetical protein